MINMEPIRVTEENANTKQEMTKIRTEFQQSDLDIEGPKRTKPDPPRVEIMPFQPITTDVKTYQYPRASGENNTNLQRSLFG